MRLVTVKIMPTAHGRSSLAQRSDVTRSSDAVHQRPFRGYVGSGGSPTGFGYPATPVRPKYRSSLVPKTRYDDPNIMPKSTEHHLQGPASRSCIAVVRHDLARNGSLVEVHGVHVYLPLLGAALVFDVRARPPGAVVPGFQSLASGWGCGFCHLDTFPVLHLRRASTSITYHVAVPWVRATRYEHTPSRNALIADSRMYCYAPYYHQGECTRPNRVILCFPDPEVTHRCRDWPVFEISGIVPLALGTKGTCGVQRRQATTCFTRCFSSGCTRCDVYLGRGYCPSDAQRLTSRVSGKLLQEGGDGAHELACQISNLECRRFSRTVRPFHILCGPIDATSSIFTKVQTLVG